MTRKASDAAIERVAERWNYDECKAWVVGNYDHYMNFKIECDREQSLSDALVAHFGADVPASLAGYVLPVVVDPCEPCPFCGGEAKWVEYTEALNTPFGLVVSHSEDCFLSYSCNFEKARETWNARAIAAQGGEA